MKKKILPVVSDTWFGCFARWTARACGRPAAFLTAFCVILAWGVTGPIFHYSDTWQLAINTGTTIVTFLMVFLIQHTQNRDNQASQIKLDELIRALKGAKNSVLDLEDCAEEKVEKLRARYTKLATQARNGIDGGPPPAKPPRRG